MRLLAISCAGLAWLVACAPNLVGNAEDPQFESGMDTGVADESTTSGTGSPDPTSAGDSGEETGEPMTCPEGAPTLAWADFDNGVPSRIALHAEGGVVALHESYSDFGGSNYAITRWSADGEAIWTWDPSELAIIPNDIASDGDGTTYVTGLIDNGCEECTGIVLVALDADGAMQWSNTQSVRGGSGVGRVVETDGAGRVFVLADRLVPPGANQVWLGGYSTAGDLTASTITNATVGSALFFAHALGLYATGATDSGFWLERYDADLASTWTALHPPGALPSDFGLDVVVHPSGAITTVSAHALLVRHWSPEGDVLWEDSISGGDGSLAIGPDGSAVLVATTGVWRGMSEQLLIAKYATDDLAWEVSWEGPDGRARGRAVAVDASCGVYAGLSHETDAIGWLTRWAF